mmetsp:Transcript_4497/g.11073  ORF Transcript_4497/g.11073 Transcript_4497/m.11073 type:complete len:266 (+) Transcript_4497:741-1538(+)
MPTLWPHRARAPVEREEHHHAMQRFRVLLRASVQLDEIRGFCPGTLEEPAHCRLTPSEPRLPRHCGALLVGSSEQMELVVIVGFCRCHHKKSFRVRVHLSEDAGDNVRSAGHQAGILQVGQQLARFAPQRLREDEHAVRNGARVDYFRLFSLQPVGNSVDNLVQIVESGGAAGARGGRGFGDAVQDANDVVRGGSSRRPLRKLQQRLEQTRQRSDRASRRRCPGLSPKIQRVRVVERQVQGAPGSDRGFHRHRVVYTPPEGLHVG